MISGPRPDADEPHREILESSPGRWAAPLLDRVPRWLFALAALALLAGGGAVLGTSQARHSPANVRPVARAIYMPSACGQFINISGARPPEGFRIVLGDAAVPPAYMSPIPPGIQGGAGPWQYGWKTGFSFRGGGLPVTVTVPVGWWRRTALFAPPGLVSGFTSQLRIPACPPKGTWYTFVSSFYLHTRSGCVPLDVTVGRRTSVLWFGLGRHCLAGRA